jgi:hypothetical protein
LVERGYAPDDPLAALLAADEVVRPRPGFKQGLRADLLALPPVAAGPGPLGRLGSLPSPAVGAAVVVLLVGLLAALLVAGDGTWRTRISEPKDRAADTVRPPHDAAGLAADPTRAAPADVGAAKPAEAHGDGGGLAAERPDTEATEKPVSSGADAPAAAVPAVTLPPMPTEVAAPAHAGSERPVPMPVWTEEPQEPPSTSKPRDPTATSVPPTVSGEPPTDEPTNEPTETPTDVPTEDPGGFPPSPTAAPTGVLWPTETPPAAPPGPAP